jgi:CRP-like cAMP-binding protein/membrane protease YdiL (CAAX protease family)
VDPHALRTGIAGKWRSVAVGPVIVGNDRPDLETANSTDVEPPLLRNLRERSALFEDVTTAQMVELRSVGRERKFTPGELILREGAPDPFVYVLMDGVANVTKTTSLGDAQMRIAELHSGDVLGELKIVDPQPSSASVIAVTEVTALVMDLDTFAESPALTAVRPILLRNVGRILAAKLRSTTGEGADAMQRELDESRARVHAGRFIVLIFTMLATYQLAISALDLVPESARPLTSVLSFIFVIWAFIPVALSLRRSPFSLESYGLTMRRSGPIALQALIWTIPLLVVVVFLKLAWLRWAVSMPGQPLFEPASVFEGRPFDLRVYLFAVGLYLIHAPLQELVARAGLQGTLQNFIPTLPGRVNWKAVVISNLLFAASHSFIGFWFCVAAFVPGLFWGWMFARQRSLVGVVVSHIAVGVWGIFVVGVQEIIGG